MRHPSPCSPASFLTLTPPFFHPLALPPAYPASQKEKPAKKSAPAAAAPAPEPEAPAPPQAAPELYDEDSEGWNTAKSRRGGAK